MAARNDIAEHRLRELRKLTPHPELLDDLVRTSRETFGWFTRHEARSLEYPWMADVLQDCDGKHLVDVGAGLSPLPIWLADRGAMVTTIDRHPVVVTAASTLAADEWGFFDYGATRDSVCSVHADIETVEIPERSIDAVYSVSVIEHMPARTRRVVLTQAAQWLVDGGSLALTVDLVPGSDALWDRDCGKRVDATEDHGTLGDLLSEITTRGFRLAQTETVSWASDVRPTDLALILAARDRAN